MLRIRTCNHILNFCQSRLIMILCHNSYCWEFTLYLFIIDWWTLVCLIYWPAPSSIQRGLEWTQLLKRVLVLCLWANFLICSSFILLFLYSTVQKSAVQYSYWPAPSSIHRGLEWSQSLKRLIVWLSDCSLCVCKFSNFFLFHPPLFIQYSTEECSTVQYIGAGP